MLNFDISSPEEQTIKKILESKNDAQSIRLKRYLAMPDLSRTPGSPLEEVVRRAKEVPSLKNFDDIKIPEVVPTKILFDLFNMPPGHGARSKSDTYYVDENDRRHMNVFHQFGGWLIAPDDKKKITPEDLKNTLSEIAISIFGNINFRFYDHNFPYTDPSFEMEAEINREWMEMLGSGMVRKSVLTNLGLTGYHGWAFGFGLERLAIASMSLPDIRLLWSEDPRVKKQLKLGQKFVEVSKYPPITRDISFVVDKSFVPNDYFDLIRDIVGDLIEEVGLLDKYENTEKFGAGKISYAYRITYRSLERTLTSEEIDQLHKKLETETAKVFGAVVR